MKKDFNGTQRRSHPIIRITVALGSVVLTGAVLAAAPGASLGKAAGPQGRSYAELAKLPDFSGVWSTIRMGAPPIAPAGGVPSAAAVIAGETSALGTSREALARRCMPHGLPNVMGGLFPMEILFTPGRVTMLLEVDHMIRTIYTDGRAHPEDPEPGYLGDSIGHWEGDTLVIDTVAIKNSVDFATGALGDDSGAHLVERVRLSGPDALSIETSLYKSGSTTPIVSSKSFQRHRDWTLREYFCTENLRDVLTEQGKPAVDLNLSK